MIYVTLPPGGSNLTCPTTFYSMPVSLYIHRHIPVAHKHQLLMSVYICDTLTAGRIVINIRYILDVKVNHQLAT